MGNFEIELFSLHVICFACSICFDEQHTCVHQHATAYSTVAIDISWCTFVTLSLLAQFAQWVCFQDFGKCASCPVHLHWVLRLNMHNADEHTVKHDTNCEGGCLFDRVYTVLHLAKSVSSLWTI